MVENSDAADNFVGTVVIGNAVVDAAVAIAAAAVVAMIVALVAVDAEGPVAAQFDAVCTGIRPPLNAV